MNNHDYPEVFFEPKYIEGIQFGDNKSLSEPYYDEVPIEAIVNHETGNGFGHDNEINIPRTQRGNLRIIDSIPYIVGNKCRPISVIKYNKKYYIRDGRHRFFAHVILGKSEVPVSVEKKTRKKISPNLSMITINKSYNDSGACVAYPEVMLEFYEKYSNLFADISSADMVVVDDIFELTLFTGGCEKISFRGCCSSGDYRRSSIVTCELLKRCGYAVDMTFISSHPIFSLVEHRGAHNMNFNAELNLDVVENIIIPAMQNSTLIKNDQIEDSLLELFQLTKRYIGKSIDFISLISKVIYIGGTYYFLLGTEDLGKKKIYLFEDKVLPFDNLKVKYLGVLNESHELFSKLSHSARLKNLI